MRIPKTYPCAVCNITFNVKPDLTWHLKSHTHALAARAAFDVQRKEKEELDRIVMAERQFEAAAMTKLELNAVDRDFSNYSATHALVKSAAQPDAMRTFVHVLDKLVDTLATYRRALKSHQDDLARRLERINLSYWIDDYRMDQTEDLVKAIIELKTLTPVAVSMAQNLNVRVNLFHKDADWALLNFLEGWSFEAVPEGGGFTATHVVIEGVSGSTLPRAKDAALTASRLHLAALATEAK